MKTNKLLRIPLAACALALLACGPGSPGGDGGGGSGGDGGGGSGGGGAVDCSAPGTVFVDAPGIGVRIEDHSAVVLRNSAGGPFGVGGFLVNGDRYMLARDGDHHDGAFAPGTYDAAVYPYHLVLFSLPDGWGDSQCSTDPDRCRITFGLSGTWEITSASPLAGAFQIGTLTAEENCWEEGPPPDTSGCALLPGEMAGCFNVE